jgi:hypothetical protein
MASVSFEPNSLARYKGAATGRFGERERKTTEASRDARSKLGQTRHFFLIAQLPRLARTAGKRGAGDVVTIMVENEDADGG